jgi:2-keto-4-pentenoate hydratase/2-oxohepta-3-ene-1,7-dioic acid hydratase in catechol pathway
MRYARFSHQDRVAYAVVNGDTLAVLHGNPLTELAEPAGEHLAISDVTLLAPCEPSKIVCVGINYGEHIAEMGLQASAEPTLFLKPPSALIGHGQAIVLPQQSRQVDLEVELAVVISHRAKNISEAEALSVVWGYTIANDVTARDLQATDAQWMRSKSFDTFCPVGPWVDTDWQPDGQRIWSEIDGVVAQDSTLAAMIADVPRIVSYVSQNLTLEPGDLILTGTPQGITQIRSGNSVTVAVADLGALTNPVI